MDQLSSIACYRRTGRTTRILKRMMKSHFDHIVYLTPRLEMSKYHRDMFIQILTDLKLDFTVRNTEIKVYALGKIFEFRADDERLFRDLKGRPIVDIYRDHTCFED